MGKEFRCRSAQPVEPVSCTLGLMNHPLEFAACPSNDIDTPSLLGRGHFRSPSAAPHVGGGCVAYFNYIIRLLDTWRTILVLTNCGPITPASELYRGGIPSPRTGRIRSRRFSSARRELRAHVTRALPASPCDVDERAYDMLR